MSDFSEALQKGMLASKSSQRNIEQIDQLFDAMNIDIQSSLSKSIEITRMVYEVDENALDRMTKNISLALSKSIFGSQYPSSNKKKVSAICIRETDNHNNFRYLASWSQNKFGFPCDIHFENSDYSCEDIESLKSVLILLLSNSEIGHKVNKFWESIQQRREDKMTHQYIEQITNAYKIRKITIDEDTELSFLINELIKFENRVQDQESKETQNQTDLAVLGVGQNYLRGKRLSMALKQLENKNVPKITETLKTLTSFKHENAEHVIQFNNSEYELHMASLFCEKDIKVSFIDTKTTSRYNSRVEFLLKNKWPVECKMPASKNRILHNINSALKKINDRKTPGIACISIESCFPNPDGFFELECIDEIEDQIDILLSEWKRKKIKDVQNKFKGNYLSYIIFSYTALTYVHNTGVIALPTILYGISEDNEWIKENVITNGLSILKSKTKK